MKIGSTLLVIALAANFAHAEAPPNEFTNSKVGFAVTKPANWQFVTAEQNMEIISRTNLNDQEAEEAMRKNSTAPLVVMMKYPEPYDDLNPSFKAHIKPLGRLPADDPVAILKLVIAPMSKMYRDYTIVKEPSETMISGLRAAHVRIHYSLQTKDGGIFPTASDLWIVPRGKYVFILGAGTRQDGKTKGRDEIERILSSVVIQN